jgi:hypothetical protein
MYRSVAVMAFVGAAGCTDEVTVPPYAEGGFHQYVISRELVPTKNLEAAMFALDLNGDRIADNQLGMAIGSVAGRGWFDVQHESDLRVDDGGVLLLAELQADDLAESGHAGFTIYQGADPRPTPCDGVDPACRRHLQGTGVFGVASDAVSSEQLLGTINDGRLSAGTGAITVTLGMFGVPMALDLIGARVNLYVRPDGLSGTIAGGIRVPDLARQLFPVFVQAVVPVIARDCLHLDRPPSCGCALDSPGRDLMDFFDGLIPGQTKDCRITEAEVGANSVVQSLLAPDVEIGSSPAVSFGFAIDAVPANIDPH